MFAREGIRGVVSGSFDARERGTSSRHTGAYLLHLNGTRRLARDYTSVSMASLLKYGNLLS
jgi:hypothetical protein